MNRAEKGKQITEFDKIFLNISHLHDYTYQTFKTHRVTSKHKNTSPYLDGIIIYESQLKNCTLPEKKIETDCHLNIKSYKINQNEPLHNKNIYNNADNLNRINSYKFVDSNFEIAKKNNLDDGDPILRDLFYNDFFTNKSVLRKKKRKRKPTITICTSNCRFEAVRRVTNSFGLKEVDEDDAWNIFWTDINITIGKAKEMKRFQRINHFLGMSEICRKNLLARNLTRMQKSFPMDYTYFPKTWCLPVEYNDAIHYSKLHRNKTYIIKPETGSQGKGIFLTKNLKEIDKNEKLICQIYISKPYLIDGYKFDIRVYVLISSCDPLRVYIYNEGLVRFATMRYADPNIHNCNNLYMHLTNYSINKQNCGYIYNHETGSKRKISTLNRILSLNGVNIQQLWESIDDSIVKTIISAWPILKHNYNACFSSHDMVQACFEILGFDILLDHNLTPYILEVNQSPSFHTDSLLDKDVKESLLADTLILLNVWQCDKKKVLEEDRRRIQERLIGGNQRATLIDVLQLYRICDEFSPEEKDKSPWQDQIEWEEKHLGNFRCAFPNGDKFNKFFQQPSNSLYLSTTSSRARGDCAKLQREGLEQAKTKSQITGRSLNIKSEKSILDETKINKGKIVKGKGVKNTQKKDKFMNNKLILPNIAKYSQTVYGPFDPLPIIESEERRRATQLARRTILIENCGLPEMIYKALKKVGSLNAKDEERYSNCNWIAEVRESEKSIALKPINN